MNTRIKNKTKTRFSLIQTLDWWQRGGWDNNFNLKADSKQSSMMVLWFITKKN